MKKIFVALLLSVFVVSSLTACSSGDNSKVNEIKGALESSTSSKVEESATESKDDSSSSIASSKPSSNKAYSTIQEFIDSDAGKQVQDSTQQSAGSDMDFELLAEGNNLVYNFKYTEEIEEFDVDAAKDYLESYDSIYTQSVEYVESIVDVEDPHIILRYSNLDGTVLYEVEYDKSGSVNEIIGETGGGEESTASTANSGKYSSLEEYIDSDEGQDIIENTQKAAGDTMEFDLLAEPGDKFVYQYTYSVDTSNIDGEYFSQYMENYEDTYSSLVSSLKMIVDVENPIIVVRYLASDGSNIYTAEFDENGLSKEIK